MDPFTQGTLGAVLPQAAARRAQVRAAGGLGFLAGMAADLDVLIRSPIDPLLFLEYHRQFTHSLFFIPLGGCAVALVLHAILGRRWKLSFAQTVLFCTLGYATHALLDTATSYGTMLLWPISSERFAWKIVSVIDPLFTLPLAGLAAASWLKRRVLYARLGLLWAGLYLGLGLVQHHNALEMARDVAAGRGHVPVRLEVKPSFGNIVVWKTLYEADGRYYADAVLTGVSNRVFAGASVAKLDPARDLPWLKTGTQQARDVERFGWFSNGYIAMDPAHANRIIDIRYSIIPNEIAGLWSIELLQTAAETDHVRFRAHRENSSAGLRRLWQMIAGEDR